ncbi:hypothetical protein DACRYDRAFT_15762 [Dacryopinax primogenitus]|uniref:Pre-rRNA-processing protein TSR2 n=1 Tax=Dacryopinax primogenitus (strain DJM 731) TaxID=1858805 RepID=M5FVA9_DACPD|nr:uncharacterized protein DACRYDRAFT_15762 [Dacryopinax primogenitus]EJU01721.1 hypothetical protein DACRYDRAFT_15762 [Dacryopinax primogenitus]
MASTSTPAGAAPSAVTPAQLTLFARAILAHLRLWPALRLALQTSTAQGKENVPLFASEILELFQSKRVGIMDEEFDTLVEDESALALSRALILTWENLASPEMEPSVKLLEEQAERAGRTRVTAQVRKEVDGDDDDEEGEEEEGDVEMQDEAPRLVERKEKPEPVVDDDGFTLVQKKRR